MKVAKRGVNIEGLYDASNKCMSLVKTAGRCAFTARVVPIGAQDLAMEVAKCGVNIVICWAWSVFGCEPGILEVEVL
ncbi:hypothetical protein HYQ46_011101 [Verticillium longisporum]|nr:hypothetical protein HYQ46_011101 [Verticillium longisporum]